MLAQTRAQAPDDPVAAAVEAAFAASPSVAAGVLLAPPHRMAPWPVAPDGQAPPPATARFAGNATLVDDGAAALLPLAAIDAAPSVRVWVRNGLGQTTPATLDRGDATLVSRGLARLSLRTPLPVGASQAAAGRAPFAGSPGYAVQFGAGSEPAWPTLTQGFLGGPIGASDLRKLGFGSTPGAPVLDAKGALIGIVLAAASGQTTWLPLASSMPSPAGVPAPPAGRALVAPDEIYEAGLRRALQVLIGGPR